MMATVNTNVAGDVPSAIQIRPDLTHLGSHCLTMLTEWLQFQDLQPLSVVHEYVKHQLPLYNRVFEKQCAGGMELMDAHDPDDSELAADLKAKLSQLGSSQWERRRCAEEYMVSADDFRVVMDMVEDKKITKKYAQHIFADFFGLSNEFNDESAEKDVNGVLNRAWRNALSHMKKGKSYQQTPLVALIPVAHFSAKKLRTGTRQKVMETLYGLLIDTLIAAANAFAAEEAAAIEPAAIDTFISQLPVSPTSENLEIQASGVIGLPQPEVPPLQQFPALLELFEASSSHDSLHDVTSEMISEAKKALAAALSGSDIPGGLCALFGRCIRDHAGWVQFRAFEEDYRFPSEKAVEKTRSEIKHGVGDTVTYIPLDGESIDALVQKVLTGNQYLLKTIGRAWEASGARLVSKKILPTIEQANTSAKKRQNSDDNDAATNNGAATNKKQKPAVKRQIKGKKRKAPVKKSQFAVSFTREGANDRFVADVITVDDDDSDVVLIECEALDRRRRKALLKERAKETKKKLGLENQRKVLAARIRDQEEEWLDRAKREEEQHKELEVRQ